MDDLGEVGVLNDLQIVGFSRPFVGHRADLGHTVMIKYPRVGPGVLNAFACGGNATAEFASDHDGLQLGLGKIHAFLSSHLGQSQRVCGSAAQNGDLIFQKNAQTGGAGEAAAEETKATHLRSGLVGHPEPDEWPEGKCKEHAVLARDSGGVIDGLPAFKHALPTLGRVQPAEGLPVVPLV